MKHLLNKILFLAILLGSTAITVKAVCPTPGATVVEVCNDAGGNGTIRAYFYDGDPATSLFLFSITTGSYVSDPLGPVSINTGIPLPPGAVAAVEFGGIPNGDYIIRVNCAGGGFVNIGGLGINVTSGNALNAAVTTGPDCAPATGGVNATGSILLNITGGTAPYDIAWPAAVTSIADRNNEDGVAESFSNLDGGTYTVQITDAKNCVLSVDIDLPIATLPSAGGDQTVCGDAANLSANAPGSGEVGTWTGPGGVIFSPNANTPNAVASNLPAGISTFTWTINDSGGVCAGNSDQVDITSNAPATVNAGPDQMTCGVSAVALDGSMGGTATTVTWTGGAGTFIPNNTSEDVSYVPTPAEVTAGSVTLTLTTNDPDGAGPCVAQTDDVIITINAPATANAGPDQTVCAGENVTLGGAFTGAASATWSGGTGTFTPDNTTLNAVYSPSPAEITAGTVTLTLTTNDPDGAGPCTAATDNVVVIINALATGNAGPDQTICAGSDATLNGIIGGSATSGTWSGGAGTFTPDNTTLNAIYSPTAGEITAGSVTLTLTTSGPCAAVTDNITLTINAAPTVDAGNDQTICGNATVTLAGVRGGSATTASWSGGTGAFFPDANALNAVYTPSLAEVTAGTVTLTLTTDDPDAAGPCVAVSDNVTITINQAATVNAGGDQTICAGGTVNLGGLISGSASTATWTGGTGSFAPNANDLNAVYTPSAAEVSAGTVTLTLTTNDPDGAGPCASVSDQLMITINALPIVDAGPAQTICAGETVTLAGILGGSASSGSWSGGTGSFAPDNLALGAIYTPSPAEVAAGTVTLTLTTNDPDGAGPCAAISDDVTVTINATGTVDAGLDQLICPDATAALSGMVGGSAMNGTWTGGAGTFAPSNNTLNATYTPTAAEITAGMVTLTLTATGACAPVTDDVVITIDQASTANAGTDQAICAGGTIALAGSVGGSAVSGTWSGGTGTFVPNNTALNATYTPSAAEIAAGTVTLTLTTTGPCTPASDNVVIAIQGPATANAGTDQQICEGNTVTLLGVIGGSAAAATWSGGAGTFSPDNTALNAVYTPTTAEVSAGTVTLTLTTSGPCAAASDDVSITIDALATVNAGADQIICSTGTATLAGSAVGGSATTGAWTIVTQPSGGDGSLSDVAQTATPASVTFTATVAGAYTLRLTTEDPSGSCDAATDDLTITVTAAATANAGGDQTICAGGTATLGGSFTGTTGITWTTSGSGTFNDASLINAVYTPSPADISAGTVTLTITTSGPCASVNDAMLLTIDPAPTVDAGSAQTICSTGSAVLSASFGGSATGLAWTSSGNGTFNDITDPDATYLPGPADIAAGTVTLTATATGSCPGVSDNVVITVNPAATVDAGPAQTVCVGGSATLNATLSGSATSITWASSGDGAFDNTASLGAVYTPGPNDIANGTVTLTATTNNPAGPCPATTDNVAITIMPIPGDQTTAGNETWIGYVYDDTGSPGTPPANINFNNAKYRGFIESTDIDNMSGASTYDVVTDEFDMNLGLAIPVQGPNVCGSHLNYFSVRYKMNKTLAAGVYRFTVGGDDGVRLLIDGVDVLPAAAFSLHSYTPPFTSDPVCLTAGVHAFEIQYFDNTAHSRLTFDYAAVPAVTTNSPLSLCVDAAAPTLTASSVDAAVTGFNWYKNGTLVFSGGNFTPTATDLDMTVAGVTTFAVTAVYACGETQPADVVVTVVNSATVSVAPQTVCASAGLVDLRTLVSESPAGGTLVFSGHPNISGNNFDPSGLAGTTVPILVDYSVGTCTAPQETLSLTISNTATVTVPAAAVAACESSAVIDLTTLVSASPSGGAFTFSGTQVTATSFDPSGLSGIQTITADYSIGGCVATTATFDIDVTSAASLTTSNVNACETGASVNLLTLVSAAPAGGTFTFSGAGVSGSLFDPSGLTGTVNIAVDYDLNGCTDNGVIQVTVLAPTDPLCTSGNCADVVIVPRPEPATCTNSDGRLVMDINPFTPVVNNTGVKITIDGTSTTGLHITRTIFNQNTFEALPVGAYSYTIEYGDPSCVKTGLFSIDQSGTVGTPVASDVVSPVCAGSATGTLTLNVPGETGNILEWSLDGGLTDPFKPFTAGGQITGIPAGPAPSFQQVISVRRNISDVCYSSVTIMMAEAVQPVSATFVVTPATCNGNDGAIENIAANGGNGGPYTFSIDGGQSFQSETSFTGIPGGSYFLRVKDAAGCETDFAANVTFPGFINFSYTKENVDCSGEKGSIKVSVTDIGQFEVALGTSQSAEPAADQFQGPLTMATPWLFDELPGGRYFLFVKSNSAACATQSGPIDILDYHAITFDLEPSCPNNDLSITLTNVTGQQSGPSMEIRIFRKPDINSPYETMFMPFPADGDIFLSNADHAFLKDPGEYRIKLVQVQDQEGIAYCDLSSETVDFIIPEALNAQTGPVAQSYPDVPSGKLQVNGFSGGLYPYEVRIELDSASSFALPEYQTNFEEAGLNQNQQVVMAYDRLPAGRYQVQVMDSLGCVVDLIARVPLDEGLFIPNIFTPNGDGSNDIFFIRNLPPAPTINQLIISNRWGKEVFASDDYQNDWDGQGVADGLYFYRLQVASGEALTGWIEIMRGQKP